MNAPTKLVAFAAVLALVFGGAVLAGAALDPTDAPVATEEHGGAGHGSDDAPTPRDADGHDATPTHDADPSTDRDASPAPDDDHADAHDATPDPDADPHAGHDAQPAGLAVAHGGYALRFTRTQLTPSRSAALRFRIVDERGRTVRDAFEVEHEKRLHLVVVRRDTAVFRHVHPEQRRDGSWSVDARLVDPGVYRAFADFTIDGEQHTLATDLFVPGRFDARELPAPATTDRAVNDDDSRSAIDVTLDAPRIRAGHPTTLRFAATRGSRPVDRLEPYLGAKGHLVALREGDLAYLHVHPTDAPADAGNDHRATADDHGADDQDAKTGDRGATSGHDHGSAGDPAPSTTSFAATFPTPGRYRLFLQVRVDGRVRTTDYTVEVAR